MFANAQTASEGWLLFQQAYAKPSKQSHLTAVGFLLTSNQPKDGGFARAVSANQPDVLTRVYLEGDSAQHFGGGVGFIYFVESKQHWREKRRSGKRSILLFHLGFVIWHWMARSEIPNGK